MNCFSAKEWKDDWRPDAGEGWQVFGMRGRTGSQGIITAGFGYLTPCQPNSDFALHVLITRCERSNPESGESANGVADPFDDNTVPVAQRHHQGAHQMPPLQVCHPPIGLEQSSDRQSLQDSRSLLSIKPT